MRLWFANLILYSAALTLARCYVPLTHRLPFTQNHRARWYEIWAMGTESFPQREKPANLATQLTTTANLWSPLIGICPQNYGTIPESAQRISDIRDWLAERTEFELPKPLRFYKGKTHSLNVPILV